MADVWGPHVPLDGPLPRRLVLARHGATDWNARHVWQGHADVPLNDLGRAQARALARRLADESFDAVWTSDLSRARETAEIVCAATVHTPQVTGLLREIDIGRWEGMGGATIAASEPETMAALARGEDVPRGGGETSAAFRERVVRGLREAASTAVDGDLLLVVHGGVIKSLVAHFLGLSVADTGRVTSGGNAGISEFQFGPGGAQLVRLNDAAHVDGIAGTNPVNSA